MARTLSQFYIGVTWQWIIYSIYWIDTADEVSQKKKGKETRRSLDIGQFISERYQYSKQFIDSSPQSQRSKVFEIRRKWNIVELKLDRQSSTCLTTFCLAHQQ